MDSIYTSNSHLFNGLFITLIFLFSSYYFIKCTSIIKSRVKSTKKKSTLKKSKKRKERNIINKDGVGIIFDDNSPKQRYQYNGIREFPSPTPRKKPSGYLCHVCSKELEGNDLEVFCEGDCQKWFHASCVKFDESKYGEDDEFICPKCIYNCNT